MNKSGKPMPVMVADVLKRIREQPSKSSSSPSPEDPIAEEPLAESAIEVEAYKESTSVPVAPESNKDQSAETVN